jgi:hypothetical protein
MLAFVIELAGLCYRAVVDHGGTDFSSNAE